MANIVNMRRFGNGYIIQYDDGSTMPMVPTPGQFFIPQGGVLADDIKDGSGGGIIPDDVSVGSSGGGIVVTPEMIMAGVTAVGGYARDMLQSATQIAAGFNEAIRRTYPGILSGKKRAACMVGEAAQETGGFALIKEQGIPPSTSYYPYVGRGWLQLTWRESYAAFGKWLKSFGIISDANLFVNSPSALENLKYAPYTAVYQFTQETWTHRSDGKRRNLFEFCDLSSSPWEDISRAINTGSPYTTFPYNGGPLRTKAINAVLGVTPDPVTAPPPSSGYIWPMKKGAYSIGALWHATGAWASWHTGQDFPAAEGTALYAIGDGVILEPNNIWQSGINTVLKLNSGEVFSYWHCGIRYPNVGARVTKGQKIATVGMTGRTFGAHLHLEYYKPGVSYNSIYESSDPLSWLQSKAKKDW